jgi:hypothetical protein
MHALHEKSWGKGMMTAKKSVPSLVPALAAIDFLEGGVMYEMETQAPRDVRLVDSATFLR